jgi:prepilin-type N-terminal cleavage/methylation domain-containing protein
MFRNNSLSGFTLIELLVTLLILGMLTSLVAPNAFSWLDSRKSAAKRDEVIALLATLPLKARLNGQAYVYETGEDLLPSEALDDVTVTFTPPLIVMPNGYCKGSQMEIIINGKSYIYPISEPNCDASKNSL